jgi:hypothetical protein
VSGLGGALRLQPLPWFLGLLVHNEFVMRDRLKRLPEAIKGE